MNFELFIAAVLLSAAFSIASFIFAARKTRGTKVADFDMTTLESRFADLISELNHVANSHVNAVEDRRDELKRVIEMANTRVRRLVSLLSDLEIIEKRLRGSIASADETEVVDIAGSALARSVGAESGAGGFSRLSRLPLERDAPQGGGTTRGKLHKEIRIKAEEGHDAAAIASQLRLQRSEVEMVLRRSSRPSH